MKPPKVRSYIYLTEEEAKALRATARKMERSRSWLIRRAWLAFLRQSLTQETAP